MVLAEDCSFPISNCGTLGLPLPTSVSVLVSSGCYNRIPQIGWLKQHLFLTVLEAGKFQVKVAQSCPILCNPMDYTVHGILQARILEWVAIPFSSGSSWPRNRTGSPVLQADSLPAELPEVSSRCQPICQPILFLLRVLFTVCWQQKSSPLTPTWPRGKWSLLCLFFLGC